MEQPGPKNSGTCYGGLSFVKVLRGRVEAREMSQRGRRPRSSSRGRLSAIKLHRTVGVRTRPSAGRHVSTPCARAYQVPCAQVYDLSTQPEPAAAGKCRPPSARAYQVPLTARVYDLSVSRAGMCRPPALRPIKCLARRCTTYHLSLIPRRAGMCRPPALGPIKCLARRCTTYPSAGQACVDPLRSGLSSALCAGVRPITSACNRLRTGLSSARNG